MHLDFGWDGIGYHKIILDVGKLKTEDQSIGWVLMLKVKMILV